MYIAPSELQQLEVRQSDHGNSDEIVRLRENARRFP